MGPTDIMKNNFYPSINGCAKGILELFLMKIEILMYTFD